MRSGSSRSVCIASSVCACRTLWQSSYSLTLSNINGGENQILNPCLHHIKYSADKTWEIPLYQPSNLFFNKIIIKGIVSVISSETTRKNVNSWFTTVRLKMWKITSFLWLEEYLILIISPLFLHTLNAHKSLFQRNDE